MTGRYYTGDGNDNFEGSDGNGFANGGFGADIMSGMAAMARCWPLPVLIAWEVEQGRITWTVRAAMTRSRAVTER